MKLILYIGHHKVGSTSLQAFLVQNAQALAAAGILHPMVDPRGLVHLLRQSIGKVDKPGQLPPDLREPHSALAYRMIADISDRPVPSQFQDMPPQADMVATLRTQIERLEPHTVILCSEVFSTFGDVDATLVDRLLAMIPEATEIQIYGVLRRPDQYLVSWHGQRFKAGEKLVPVAEAVADYAGNVHADYRRALECWITRCSGATLTLRNYADVVKAGNSVRDFRLHAQVKWPPNLTPPPRINQSLPLAVMEIARRANHALADQEAADLRGFLMRAGDTLDLVPNAQIDMYGPKARAQLLALFRPVQAYLGTVSGCEAFFPDLELIGICPPVPQHEAVRGALAHMGPEGIAADLPRKTRAFLDALRKEYKLV